MVNRLANQLVYFLLFLIDRLSGIRKDVFCEEILPEIVTFWVILFVSIGLGLIQRGMNAIV